MRQQSNRNQTSLRAAVKRAALIGAAISGLGLLQSDRALAATKSWDGNGSVSNIEWNNANNWNSNGIPTSGDDIVLDNSTLNPLPVQMTTDGLVMTVKSIKFAAAADLTLGNSGSGTNSVSNITLTGLGDADNTLLSMTSAGTTFSIIPNVSGSKTLSLTLGGSGAFNVSAGTLLVSAVIGETGGARSITKTGGGTLVLSGSNSYAGGVTINGGVLAISADNNLGTTAGGLTLGGGTLQLNSNLTINAARAFSLTASTSNTLNTNGNNATFSSAITGSGSFTKMGSGTFTLTGANGAISAATRITLNGGTLLLDNSTASSARINDSAAIMMGGGTIQFTSAGAGVNEAMGALTLNSSDSGIGLTSSGTAGQQTRANITNFTRDNRATALLRGSNLGQGASASYNSPTTGNSYFKISVAGNESTFVSSLAGTATTSYASGTQNMPIVPYLFGDTGGAAEGKTFISYVGTNGVGGGSTGPGFIALATGNYASALPGAVSDNNIRLTTLGVTPAAGTMNSLLILSTGSINGSNKQTIASGALAMGTFASGASAASIATPLQFGTLSGNREAVITVTSVNTLTLSGALTTTEGITKAGEGTLILSPSAAATHSGPITVNNGTLQIGTANNVIPDSAAVTVSSPGTLNLNSFSETTGSLAGSGNVTLGSAALTTGGNNTSTGFSGVISGTGSLTKTGTGKFTLSGANTYSGTTTISNGTLVVNGTHSGGNNYTVSSGATLAGNGTISFSSARNVTLNGTVAPGDSPGKLTIGSNSTTVFAPAGIYLWEINSQSGTAGVNWDTLALQSVSVTATNALGSRFIIKLISLDSSNQPGAMTQGAGQAWNPDVTAKWVIASATSGFSAGLLNRFSIDTSSFANTNKGGFYLNVSSGNLEVVYVPEPASGLGLAGLMVLMCGRRSRRRVI